MMKKVTLVLTTLFFRGDSFLPQTIKVEGTGRDCNLTADITYLLSGILIRTVNLPSIK